MLLDKDNRPIEFTGTVTAAVDSSNRLMLPLRWRPTDKTVRFHLLPWPLEAPSYLLALPPERWDLLRARLANASLADEGAADTERYIAGAAHEFVLDNVGRFVLPAELVEMLGCQRPKNEDGSENKKAPTQVALVGRLDKFEIWSPESLLAKQAEARRTVGAKIKTGNMML